MICGYSSVFLLSLKVEIAGKEKPQCSVPPAAIFTKDYDEITKIQTRRVGFIDPKWKLC
jgi:hypothetical protein